MNGQTSGPTSPAAKEPAKHRSKGALRWATLILVGLVVYAVVGWAVVRYGPRQHTVLHTRGGDVKVLGAQPLVQPGSRRLQLFIADPDDNGDEARASEILDAVVPDHPANDLRSIGIAFVQFQGIWPVTFTTSNGYVFARSPQGGWSRADPDRLHDHLTAFASPR